MPPGTPRSREPLRHSGGNLPRRYALSGKPAAELAEQRQSVTVYEGQTTIFTAIAVSDAEMTPYYQWYLVTSGGSLPGTPLTGNVVNGTNLNMSLIPANYDNAQIYCIDR